MQQEARNCEDFKLTDKACVKIHEILSSGEAKQAVLDAGADIDISSAFIRFSVMPGGCKGMQYDFSLDTKHEDGDLLLSDNGKIIVVVDNISIPFIKGSELDYTESLGSSSFKVINPNMGGGGGCGCGKSFTPNE